MAKYRNLDKGDVLPASWTDALQEFISTITSNLVITRASNTSIQISAGSGSNQVAIGVGGLWRYRSTNVTASMPGGAGAGTYDVLAVASANIFGGSDADTTDYTFGVQIVATGGSASGTHNGAAIVASRKIGELLYSGTAITRITLSPSRVITFYSYEQMSWAVPGQLKANPAITDPEYIPGGRVPINTTYESMRAIGAYGSVGQGTSATVSLFRKAWGGADAAPTGWTGLVVDAEEEFAPTAFAVSHRDRLRPVITALSGTVYVLEFTVVLECTFSVVI